MGSPRAAGPLSGHTPHRGSYSGAPGRPGTASPAASSGATPGVAAPHTRGDYISPTGTRIGSALGRPANIPSAPIRRAPASGAEDAQRREAQTAPQRVARPLPPVAASPSAPTAIPRRPDQARPAAPAQRPDVKFVKYTPEQLLELARSGQLRGGPQTQPRGGAPSLRPASGPVSRTGMPPGAPGAPATGPTRIADDEEERGRPSRGAAGDRAGRRPGPSKRPIDRRGITSTLPARALLDEEETQRAARSLRRSHKGSRTQTIAPRKTAAQIEPPISVRSLSEAIGVKASDLLRKLFLTVGPGVNINSALEEDAAIDLALEFGVELSIDRAMTAEEQMLQAFDQPAADASQLVPRPPIITVLGHVDHGKTSLLDRIRQANVVATESGGITQHIGAYQIDHNGRKITFVDTPGHEAFTAMRARGANVTDIVVLVVAADDGVMPQTMEAIAHAKAAEVPVVVALNKIDLPNAESTANINKIYGELSLQGLNPAEWGGETEVIRTSATTGRGIPELLETLETLAEIHELKANPRRPAVGTCLEASISEGRGVVATLLVQDGTLKLGDVIVCGDGYGRVRALFNDRGDPLVEAPPSTPVELSGLDSVPTAGEAFAVVDDISRAREIAETRRARGRGASLSDRQPLTLENVYSRLNEQKVKSLNLILKADVQGSLEALVKELDKLKNDEVPIRLLLKAVGGITESDVTLAEASDAIIIGFRVAPEDRALAAAEEKNIDIRRYDIIYQVTDEIKKAVEGMLVPEVKEVHLGRANVRQVFKISKVGTVAGCFVVQGTIERGAKARVIRDTREIYKGTIDALKRFKDDVREVRENFECGIKISNFDDLKVDDTIEAYKVEVIRRTL
jgi:translation initiation factor IF-2